MTDANTGAAIAAVTGMPVSESVGTGTGAATAAATGRKRIRWLPDALLWCLFCILLSAGFLGAATIALYSPVSLRYEAPVSGQAAYAARQYSIAQNSEAAFWPTFWREYKSTFAAEFITATADCIAFSGDASLVWPAVYVSGAAPGVLDGMGCAVSEMLAWRLWGSTDVVGRAVDIDGSARLVRGVFKGKTELALLSFRDEDTTQSWNAVELSGGPAIVTRSTAESYASVSGLGRPVSALTGGHAFLAGLMAALPLLIPACYTLAMIAGAIGKRGPFIRNLILFLILIIFAAVLPTLLEFLPVWLVPTRWSDFSFWISLLRQIPDGLREFLSAAPRLRDVELSMLFLKQAGIAFLSICCSLTVCFRWHIRMHINHPVKFAADTAERR